MSAAWRAKGWKFFCERTAGTSDAAADEPLSLRLKMGQSHKQFYEFGSFRLDANEQQLWRGGEEIQLTQKTFKLLLLLVENSGHVLEKNELIEKIWPDAFVEENRLADNISTLRKALGDDPKAPNFIRTVPGRGYRFVAEVRQISDEAIAFVDQRKTHVVIEDDDDSSPALLSPGKPPLVLDAPSAPGIRRGLLTPILIAVVLIVGAAVVLFFYLRRRATAASAPVIKSIAVLPFKPLVAAERDESLELGMADTLIARLSRIGQFTVRPTNAVRRYTQLEDEAAKAGRELTVDAVLDGTIQKSGDRVRVSVRLVRSVEGQTIWSQQFDEKFTDIFAVQDSISQRVAGALIPKLSNEEAARLTKHETENSEAYRLYLTGRYFWNKRTAEDFAKAIDYYQRAIAADPNYALAHAGLAESYVLLPNWTEAMPEESFMLAERLARRALELDPQLAEAYTALGAVKIYLHHDWAGGGEDYRRATELDPNYATARQWYAEWLCSAGRLTEAVTEAETAQRLDPLSPIITFEYGVALYYSRRLTEAEAQFRKALELDSGFFRAHVFLSRVYFDSGRDDESIGERALVLARGDEAKAARFGAIFRTAYRAGGRQAYLRKQLEMRNEPGIFHANRVGGWVESCALLHDKDCTFEALREVERTRHPLIDSVKVDPYLDFIRADPRYTELLRRLNLPL